MNENIFHLGDLKSHNRVYLHKIATVCVRYSSSDRAGPTAAFKACGVVSELIIENVISRSKFRREW